MITGEMKSKVDRLWTTFWNNGISNPLSVIEQISYLLFIKRLDDLHQHVATMARDNFLVRRHLQQVEEFSDRERWNQLNNADVEAIAHSLAKLPNGLPADNHLAKRFDLLCVKLQLAILKNSQDFIKLRDQVRDLLHRLEEKQTIPMVKVKLALIADIQTEEWWSDVTPGMIDQMRRQLQDLIKFIDPQEQRIIYTDFEDVLGEVKEVDVPLQQTGLSPYQYRKKDDADQIISIVRCFNETVGKKFGVA